MTAPPKLRPRRNTRSSWPMLLHHNHPGTPAQRRCALTAFAFSIRTPNTQHRTPKAVGSLIPQSAFRHPHSLVVAAFYVDWDESSLSSLRQHAGDLTHLMPEWLHLNADGRSFTSDLVSGPGSGHDSAHQALSIAHEHGIAVLPLFNNYAGDQWRAG